MVRVTEGDYTTLDSNLLQRIANWYRYNDGYYRGLKLHFASMEQLWLAFVMKEKFNKVWPAQTIEGSGE